MMRSRVFRTRGRSLVASIATSHAPHRAVIALDCDCAAVAARCDVNACTAWPDADPDPCPWNADADARCGPPIARRAAILKPISGADLRRTLHIAATISAGSATHCDRRCKAGSRVESKRPRHECLG